MLYIVPSRGRPEKILTLIGAWETTRTHAELFIALDVDDPTVEDYIRNLKGAPPWVRWARRRNNGMIDALNYYARQFKNEYNVIGFMGDDHAPRTLGWDAMMTSAVTRFSGGVGVAYGNDLLQGANLPTAVAVGAPIVRALDRIVPQTLFHLYADNYWKKLGEQLDRLTYVPDCIIEHMHPVAGKSSWDERYEAVNAGAVYERDAQAYAKFIADGEMERDVERVRKYF